MTTRGGTSSFVILMKARDEASSAIRKARTEVGKAKNDLSEFSGRGLRGQLGQMKDSVDGITGKITGFASSVGLLGVAGVGASFGISELVSEATDLKRQAIDIGLTGRSFGPEFQRGLDAINVKELAKDFETTESAVRQAYTEFAKYGQVAQPSIEQVRQTLALANATTGDIGESARAAGEASRGMYESLSQITNLPMENLRDMEDVLKYIQDSEPGTRNALTKIGGAFARLREDAAGGIGGDVSALGNIGDTALQVAAPGISTNKLMREWQDTKNFFTNTVPGFFHDIVPSWAAPLGKGLALAWTNSWNYVTGTAWPNTKGFFTDTIPNFFTETVPGWADNIGDGLKTAWNASWDWVTNTGWPETSNFFTDTIPNFFTETIPGWASPLTSGIQTAWNASWDWVTKTGWPNAKVLFTDIIPNFFTQTVPGWAGPLAGGVKSMWDASWNWVTNTGWPATSAFFSDTIPSFFTETIPGWASPLTSGIQSMWNTSWDWVKGPGWSTVSNFFTSTIPLALANLTPGYIGTFGTVLRGMWNSSWDWVTNTGWPATSTFFSDTIPSFFTETVPGWAGALGSGVKAMWDASWAWIFDTAWPNVKLFFTGDIPNFFTETVPGWAGALGSGIKSMWDASWNWVKNTGWPSIKSFFTETIPSFFSDLTSNLLPSRGSSRGGSTSLPPSLPGAQYGGIARSPTTVNVGEGGKPEAIIPLTALQQYLRPEQAVSSNTGGNVSLSLTMNYPVFDNEIRKRQTIRELRQLLYEESRRGFTGGRFA